MLRLTEWLSPAAAIWCREIDRFDEVYPAERIVLAKSAERRDAPGGGAPEDDGIGTTA